MWCDLLALWGCDVCRVSSGGGVGEGSILLKWQLAVVPSGACRVREQARPPPDDKLPGVGSFNGDVPFLILVFGGGGGAWRFRAETRAKGGLTTGMQACLTSRRSSNKWRLVAAAGLWTLTHTTAKFGH